MREVREIGREALYKGFLSVDKVTLAVEGEEKPLVREVIERGDAVAVLIYHRERKEFLFVRQLRPPMIRHGEPWLLETVAGMIDPGESPEESAVREVEEEVGYLPQALQPLGAMVGSPGGLSEKVWLYFAEISEGEKTGDGGGLDDENIEMVWLAPSEAYRRLDAYEFHDAKTQITLLRVRAQFPVES
jgi:ADP-ribose pyrophosphatase